MTLSSPFTSRFLATAALADSLHRCYNFALSIALALCLLLAAPAALASQTRVTVPESVPIGEPFLVSLGGEDIQSAAITWLGKTITIVPSSTGQPLGTCDAMLGMPLGEKNKELPLQIAVTRSTGVEKLQYSIQVVRKKYPLQKLTVPPKMVNPPASEQKRIEQNRREMREALSIVSPVRHWNPLFIRPVPGVVTSEYGLRREFNGQKKNPHQGLDLDGMNGDPIVAAESGTVVLASSHYFGGNTIVIDHGLGVFTIYLHLSAFDVTKNQQVKRGQRIGAVGSTGRVTGPHLHLSFNVLGQSVNPSTVLEPLPAPEKQ